MRVRFFCLLVMTASGLCCEAQALLKDVPASFNSVPSSPTLYYFDNRDIVAPPGGHLQGIQGWSDAGHEYVIITGSSEKFSYYLTTSITRSGKRPSLHKLLDTPFRHAGGCQLANGQLAVGIEDNIAKDKSKVILVSMSDHQSTEIIVRQGTFKRSTAGAVGITKLPNGKYMVAVGDWDSRHFDFYLSRDTSANAFDSIYSISQPDTAQWGSYQSFNLLHDASGNLFAIGFCRDANGNRADLFRFHQHQMELIQSRYFKCSKGNSFRYGGGLRVEDNKLVLYACPRKLKRKNWVNVFGL